MVSNNIYSSICKIVLPHYVGSLAMGDGKGGSTKIVLQYLCLKVKVGFALSRIALEMGFHVLIRVKSSFSRIGDKSGQA